MTAYRYVSRPDAGILSISTPTETYEYDKKSNVVKVIDGAAVHTWVRWGRFIEDMKEVTKRYNGQINTRQEKDHASGKQVIALEMSTKRTSLQARVDPQTKLPLSAHFIHDGKPNPTLVLKDADRIEFGVPVPDGIFDFQIPEGTQVVKVAPESLDAQFPAKLVAYAVALHGATVLRAGELTNWRANAHIYYLDPEMNLRFGMIGMKKNYTDQPWSGEIYLGNCDSLDMTLFDAWGERQNVRIEQRKLFSPGRFKILWALDEPWPSGQVRAYVMVTHGNRSRFVKDLGDATCELRMRNHFGAEVLEDFFLALAPGITIQQQPREPDHQETIGDVKAYVWQSHVPPNTTNEVTVILKRESP
jgi:hypothetical protein